MACYVKGEGSCAIGPPTHEDGVYTEPHPFHSDHSMSGQLVTEGSASATRETKSAVTVVIPCYNEREGIEPLDRILDSVERTLSDVYAVDFLFVDDCSNDGTWDMLRRLCRSRSNRRVVRHVENRGVAAAICTGIDEAHSDVVCSIDSDCTYDPHELRRMIPLLSEGVDLVTASPYHPGGAVVGVPAWRLFLSKTLSFMYRRLLPDKLYTYTSCFRVYRKSAVSKLALRETGFVGVAELIAEMSLRGSRIVEYPTTLSTRTVGTSKMKTVRTIMGHLRLLLSILGDAHSLKKSNDPTSLVEDDAV